MLCADGARDGTEAGIRKALFAYNHATWYVDHILAIAAGYAAPTRTRPRRSPASADTRDPPQGRTSSAPPPGAPP